MKTVGERIRQAREWRRLSQAELAAAAGFKHQSAIGNLEGRATGRGGFRLAEIAKVLRVPVEWLLNGPDSDVPPDAALEPLQHHSVQERTAPTYRPLSDLDRAVSILKRLPQHVVSDALRYLRYLEAQTAPSPSGADHSVSAPQQQSSR